MGKMFDGDSGMELLGPPALYRKVIDGVLDPLCGALRELHLAGEAFALDDAIMAYAHLTPVALKNMQPGTAHPLSIL